MKITTKHFLLENKPKKKCRYCKSKENLTYDHKIPLIKGGTNDIKNIQVLCKECNQMKSSLSHGEVIRLLKWAKKIIEKKKEVRIPIIGEIDSKTEKVTYDKAI